MSTATTTVFWPVDVKRSGVCYGWSKPSICVAGVLDTRSLVDAEQVLASLINQHPSLAARPCGSHLAVLGSCSLEAGAGCRPLLDFVPSDYILIYYHRHPLTSMRHYSCGSWSLRREIEGDRDHVASSAKTSLHHNFALASRQRAAGLGPVVVNQINTAAAVEHFLQAKGVRICPKVPSMSCDSFTLARLPRWMESSSFARQLVVQIKHVILCFQNLPYFKELVIDQALALSQYTRFYNIVWLSLNDKIIGLAVGRFLQINCTLLAHLLGSVVQHACVGWTHSALVWLDSWPAGLKLNTELSRFYSSLFLTLFSQWEDLLQPLADQLPKIINAVGLISFCGLTFAMAITLDILKLLTLHIRISHAINAIVCSHLFRLLGSLWILFRGKRYNLLQQRIDSWQYDVDQLLFGTILFTLIVFLLPTITAYYLLFALMQAPISLSVLLMNKTITLMNQLALFGPILWIKDPWRMPWGVYLTIETQKGSDTTLTVQNQSVSLKMILMGQCLSTGRSKEKSDAA